jgi:DNA-binding transcriptional LysR family regulator
MDLYQLRYFFAIARYQNITKAAVEELFISQSALTLSMQNLEADLGVKLFIRSGKHISLSPCGKELQRRLKTILPQINSLPAVMRRYDHIYRNTVNVGINVASAYFIPIIMEKFVTKHPDILFRFHSSDLTFCDFMITITPPDGDVDGIRIVEGQELFLLVPENSKLAQFDNIRLTDVKGYNFILQTNNHSIRNIIDSYFVQAGFLPNVSIECDFVFMIPDMVSQGYGIAIVTSDVAKDLPGLKLLHITSPICARDIYMTWSKDAIFTDAMNQFYEFCCAHFQVKPPVPDHHVFDSSRVCSHYIEQ